MKNKEKPGSDQRTKEFENLYILTYQSLYRHAKLIFNSKDEKVKELLILIYVEAYERGEQLQKEKMPLEWLLKRADFIAEAKLEATKEMLETSYAEEKMQSKEAKKENLTEIDETSLLLEIEDRLNIMDEHEPAAVKTRTRTVIQGFFSIVVFIAAVIVIFLGVWKIKNQLDVLHDPFEKRFSDGTISAEGNFQKLDKNNNCIQVGDKAVVLSDNGNILYSMPLEESEFADLKPENPEIQTKDEWMYYLPCPERENSQLSLVTSELVHTLFRIKDDDSQMEVIAQDVDNFCFWENSVYVSQYDRVQKIDLDKRFEKRKIGLYAWVENDNIHLQDMLGRNLKTDNENRIYYEDRTFVMQGDRIENVISDVREKNHVSFYLKEMEEEKTAIYCKVNGKERLFAEGKKTIDSFCVTDDWLYFSTYFRKNSGIQYSRFYRKSIVKDTEAEQLGEEYLGRMFQMYYSEDTDMIYANYIPQSWRNGHGVIAVISPEGEMSYLDDEKLRKDQETTGNDMLEFVMVQEGNVYCFWKDNYWKKNEKPVGIWRKVLVIPDRERIMMGN